MNDLTSPALAGKSFARSNYNEPLLCGWRVDVLGDRRPRCTHFYWHGVSLCSKRRISAEAARMPQPGIVAHQLYRVPSPMPCPRCLRRSRKYHGKLKRLRQQFPLAPIVQDDFGRGRAPKLLELQTGSPAGRAGSHLQLDPRLRGDVDGAGARSRAPLPASAEDPRPRSRAWGNGIPKSQRTRYA